VSGNEREFGIGKLAVDNMKVGATDSAGVDAEEEFSRLRCGA
jgi:hypothetical protein